MPKKTKDFPVRLEFMTTYQMRLKLKAYAFLTGSGTAYARPARNLLEVALEAAISRLDPERRKAFDEIMANIRIADPEPKE